MDDLTEEERELLLNAVRMAISQCQDVENAFRMDHAHQVVYGTEQGARGVLELLAVASQTTAGYVQLLKKLNGSVTHYRVASGQAPPCGDFSNQRGDAVTALESGVTCPGCKVKMAEARAARQANRR